MVTNCWNMKEFEKEVCLRTSLHGLYFSIKCCNNLLELLFFVCCEVVL